MKIIRFFYTLVLTLVLISVLAVTSYAAPVKGILTPETHPLLESEVIENDIVNYALPLQSTESKSLLSIPPGEEKLYDFEFWGVTSAGTVKTDTFEVSKKNVQINSQADSDNYNQKSGEYYITLYRKNWLGIGVSQGALFILSEVRQFTLELGGV